MQLIYLGPREVIRIIGQGDHRRGESKDYPDDVAEWLLATSRRNRWEAVDLPDQADQTDQAGEPTPTPAPKPKRKRK